MTTKIDNNRIEACIKLIEINNNLKSFGAKCCKKELIEQKFNEFEIFYAESIIDNNHHKKLTLQ